MPRSRRSTLTALVASLAALQACSDPARESVVGAERGLPAILDSRLPSEQPLNVLLYVVDTLRADRLSLYGYHRPTSPRLEELAQRAIVFENAYAPSAHTVPSITALFASRYPSDLGGRLRPDGPARTTLAESFRAAEYDTAAFQANFLLIRPLGYARGFDEYHLWKKEPTESEPPYLNATELHEKVLRWLRSPHERPFFLYVQSMDVHYPYLPPAPFRDMFVPDEAEATFPDPGRDPKPDDAEWVRSALIATFNPDRYDGCVAYADHEIGELLAEMEALGLLERTVVVITSDHGEPLLQRGHFLHGLSVYEELVHIPLMLLLPWQRGAERVEQIINLIDLTPTLLDLAGIPVPEQFRGHSLVRELRTLEPPFAVGEQMKMGTHEIVSWYARQGPWKLIMESEGSRLFHLPSDPGEESDVSQRFSAKAGHLGALIGERSPALRGEAGEAPPLEADLSEPERRELREALEALGYVSGQGDPQSR